MSPDSISPEELKIEVNGSKSEIVGINKITEYARGYKMNGYIVQILKPKNSKLKTILYEVKNTFNEQHTYVFRVKKSSHTILHKCKKKFYVSPFIEMKTFYNFRLSKPKKKIKILIKQHDIDGPLLIAQQVGKKIKLNNQNLFFEFLKHPLMSFKVIAAIHFEAFRLWVKGVNLVKKKTNVKNSLSLEN